MSMNIRFESFQHTGSFTIGHKTTYRLVVVELPVKGFVRRSTTTITYICRQVGQQVALLCSGLKVPYPTLKGVSEITGVRLVIFV